MSEQDGGDRMVEGQRELRGAVGAAAAGLAADRAESSRASLKYRRGEGEIVIVNHDGRGWWDP